MNEEMLELVRQAAAGDGDAFGTIYEKSYPKLFRYTVARVRNEDDAMEICQEIYANMLAGFRGLQDPASFPGWMKRTVDNTMYKYLSKAYRRREFTELHGEENGEETDWESALEDEDLSVQPEAYMDQAETNRLVLEMLKTLNEKERTAIVMRYYEDADVKQIAQALGCPEGSVKTYLFRGRGKVEKQVRMLEKQGVKLYSLAPLPFFVWMLRLARAQGTTAAALGCAGTAAGAAAGAGAAAKAGTAAKTAGAAVGKTAATKVVAGALAVSMTVGAGVAVAHNSKGRQNEQAHEIYENLLDDYRNEISLGRDAALRDENLFWDTLADRFLRIDYGADNNMDLLYIEGETFDDGTPLPQTTYKPYLDYIKIDNYYRNFKDCAVNFYYAYYDIDNNGIDELFIGIDCNPAENALCFEPTVYTVNDGLLSMGNVQQSREHNQKTWRTIQSCQTYGYRTDEYQGDLHIRVGDVNAFSPAKAERAPVLNWRALVPIDSTETGTIKNTAVTTNQQAHKIYKAFLRKNLASKTDTASNPDFYWAQVWRRLFYLNGTAGGKDDYSFVYTPGNGFSPRISIFESKFSPNLFIFQDTNASWNIAYRDINSDGIDELLVQNSNNRMHIYVYMLENGRLLMADAKSSGSDGEGLWSIEPGIIRSPKEFSRDGFSTYIWVYTCDPETFHSFTISDLNAVWQPFEK